MNKKKNMSKNVVVIAIIVLFVGASVVSNISGNTARNNGFVIEDLINEEFVYGEFIVKFNAETLVDVSKSTDNWISTGLPTIDVLNEKYHVTCVERLFRSCKKQGVENPYLHNIFKLNVPRDSDILSVVQEYLLDSIVVYAEPNYIARACMTPNDPDFDLQWALHNTGQTGGTHDADIDAPEAWDIETGDENIVIAISDTGVDWDHLDLAANIWVNSDEILDGTDTDGNGFIDDIRGWDFVNNDNNPMDDNGHGTYCAGIAGASTDNNIGVAGVCWNCSIMPVKVLNSGVSGTVQDCADGFVYAVDNGADVISMSLGSYSNISLMKDAVDYAYSQGAVLVAAAGNGDTNQKFYPAGYDNVVAVAATNYKDKKVYSSNYGSWIDVAAPGWDIYTTAPDDNYAYFTYTSSAAPHVAGLSGLILSKTPSYSPEEVMSIIRNNTDPYNSSVYIGTGRINAYKALIEYNTPPNKPDKPSGETHGSVGVEYTYNTIATDPQGDQVYYMWDWDDGNTSGWLGLKDSGETVTAKYTWAVQGNYKIKVKAKDRGDAESEWSDPLTIYVVDAPILEIGNITGGLFKVSTVIRNIGGVDATKVNWSIVLNGGIILMGKETTGNIPILHAGGESMISSSLIFGFGKIVVTVAADGAEETVDGKQLIIFTIINKNDANAHTVFAEYASSSLCRSCKDVHASLKKIYDSGNYPFYYVSLVRDKNPLVNARINDDYNIYGVPTVFFDGGYEVNVGSGIFITRQYKSSINNCENRVVSDIDIDLDITWLGGAEMRVNVSVDNNEASIYEGHIRVYITEIVSSMGWKDFAGYPYTFAFLDFAFNEDISISGGDTWYDSTTWDGGAHGYSSITEDNIMIIAAVFNSEWHQGYAWPPSSNPFDAYYVDETDAATFAREVRLK